MLARQRTIDTSGALRWAQITPFDSMDFKFKFFIPESQVSSSSRMDAKPLAVVSYPAAIIIATFETSSGSDKRSWILIRAPEQKF